MIDSLRKIWDAISVEFRDDILSRWIFVSASFLFLGGIAFILIVLVLLAFQGVFSPFNISLIASGDFGAYVAGTVGVLWSGSGVLFFYLALRVQNRQLELQGTMLAYQVRQGEQTRIRTAIDRDAMNLMQLVSSVTKTKVSLNPETGEMSCEKEEKIGRAACSAYQLEIQKLNELDENSAEYRKSLLELFLSFHTDELNNYIDSFVRSLRSGMVDVRQLLEQVGKPGFKSTDAEVKNVWLNVVTALDTSMGIGVLRAKKEIYEKIMSNDIVRETMREHSVFGEEMLELITRKISEENELRDQYSQMFELTGASPLDS